MKHKLRLAALLAATALRSVAADACDFCMLAQGVNPYLTATGKGLTLDISYMQLNDVYDRATQIDSGGKKEGWLVYSLTGFYPITDELTLLATLPYTVKTNIDFDQTSNSNPGTLTNGIGDMTLTGRYTLLKNHSLESTLITGLLAGIKLPTGSTNLYTAQGAPVDRHALPGTGSWDFDLGLTGSYSTASGFQLTWDAVYRISTTGSWDQRSHKYGNMLNYSAKAYYRVAKTDGGSSFLPLLGLSGETMGKETGTQTDAGYDPDLVNLSTGGTVLFADIGLYSILNSNTFAYLAYSKAFYHYENYDPAFDADPSESYRINFSVTYLF